MDWKLEVASVPVSDVDRAKRFYAEQLGFAVDVDQALSETVRLVQLTPPGSGCSIHIGLGMGEAPPGSSPGLTLVVDDIDAARAQLVERGVDVGPVQHYEDGRMREGHGEDWNNFLFVSDPDGNPWTIQERPRGRG